jgi:hypothetical protein
VFDGECGEQRGFKVQIGDLQGGSQRRYYVAEFKLIGLDNHINDWTGNGHNQFVFRVRSMILINAVSLCIELYADLLQGLDANLSGDFLESPNAYAASQLHLQRISLEPHWSRTSRAGDEKLILLQY